MLLLKLLLVLTVVSNQQGKVVTVRKN